LLKQIEGTIVAPEEPKLWDPKSPRNWLTFNKLTGVRIQGGGVIDGSGSKWWAASCKVNKTNVNVACPFSFLFSFPFVKEQD
jgi:galacturan 1,4-alpha-galacturonidase